MQEYDEETIVIKYGGHAMGAEDLAKAFARDIVLLEQTAINPVVVHGGGPQIATMLKRLGIQSEFAAGLRITDAATIEIVEMVLAGSINKQLVGYINEAGGKAVGLCGKDGNMVMATKATRTMVDPDSHIEKVVDLGFVGEPEKVDLTLLNQLIGHELIPVLAPLATSKTRADLQRQRRHLRRRGRGRAEGQAAVAVDRRSRRARQVEEADPGTVGEGRAQADRRRHHFRRHDPEGRDLHLRARTGRPGRRHHRRQDAARGLARIVHQPRHGHADPQVMIHAATQMRAVMAGFIPAIALLASAAPAHADLKLCNRMSYVVEVAIGIDDKAATATRGWFRIDPAACRVVVQGTLAADRILLNARALGVYGSSPIPQNGGDTLCIAPDNFVIAAARQCRAGQTPAPFTQINPTPTDDGNLVAYLAEDSEYDDEQARLAGIQRLLVIAGYDAAPIDGVDGPKTQAALAAFLKSRGLTPDIVQAPNFFTMMIDAVQSPSSTGLTWCNDTPHKVMAAVATDDGKTVISRGWYRIDPGKCLHPDVSGQPRQIFSFAEAVDADNRTVKFKDKPLNWGGTTQLCTRESKFEINEQGDCGTRGLAVTGFAAVDMSSGGKTLRFAMP